MNFGTFLKTITLRDEERLLNRIIHSKTFSNQIKRGQLLFRRDFLHEQHTISVTMAIIYEDNTKDILDLNRNV